MENKIWLSSPHMGSNELEYVKKAFETNWIAPLGPFVDKFESDLAKITGVNNVAALSSGTSALHLALILLGVAENDIVLCQSMTFSASANPIKYQKATPVFIDSEYETWNICPKSLKEAILKYIGLGKKPKAIIVVDLYGMPAKFNEIIELSNEYQIPIIEDAAEALGSTYFGKACGSFGAFSILSFNGNKIITTSSGGALLSNNEDSIKEARNLATQARDHAPHYQHSKVGYNYRLSNVLAGIGIGQLEVLGERVKMRRRNFEFYKNAFSNIPGISFLDEPEGFYSNRWLTCILVDSKNTNGIRSEDLRLALDKENIESRPLWKPMHLQPVFSDTDFVGGDVCEQLFNNGLCLPSGSNLNEVDLKRVVRVIEQKFKYVY